MVKHSITMTSKSSLPSLLWFHPKLYQPRVTIKPLRLFNWGVTILVFFGVEIPIFGLTDKLFCFIGSKCCLWSIRFHWSYFTLQSHILIDFHKFSWIFSKKPGSTGALAGVSVATFLPLARDSTLMGTAPGRDRQGFDEMSRQKLPSGNLT